MSTTSLCRFILAHTYSHAGFTGSLYKGKGICTLVTSSLFMRHKLVIGLICIYDNIVACHLIGLQVLQGREEMWRALSGLPTLQ